MSTTRSRRALMPAILGVLALTTVLLAGCGKSLTWQSYTDPQGIFTASLPGTPTEEKGPAEGGMTYTVDLGKTGCYIVNYTKLPGDFSALPKENQASLLKQMGEGAVSSMKAESSTTKDTLYANKYPCRDIKAKAGPGWMHMWIIGCKSYLFMLTCGPDNEKDTAPDAQKFYDDFKVK